MPRRSNARLTAPVVQDLPVVAGSTQRVRENRSSPPIPCGLAHWPRGPPRLLAGTGHLSARKRRRLVPPERRQDARHRPEIRQGQRRPEASTTRWPLLEPQCCLQCQRGRAPRARFVLRERPLPARSAESPARVTTTEAPSTVQGCDPAFNEATPMLGGLSLHPHYQERGVHLRRESAVA